MERTEKDTTSSAPRLLPPIDASYQPSRAVTKIPGTSSLEEILEILERDGGVVLTDFVSLESLDKIYEELEPHTKPIADNDSYDNFIGKKTLVVPGLVGKSDTIASILDTNETIEKLLKVILEERYPAVFEQHTEELVIDPLLSISLGFNVSHGSPRQALHRDDMVFSSKQHRDMKINEVDGFSCFLAGTRITRENGGTMVILGSHKWEHDRRGRPDEVSFLGKPIFSMIGCDLGPSVSLTKIHATAPINDILAILERDGALILTDVVSVQDVAAINDELEPYIQKARAETHAAYDFIPKQTLMVPGIVGKSPRIAKIAEFEVIDKLRTMILQKKCTTT